MFVYQLDSYRHWEQHFGRDDFVYGMFGENLTIDGLPDDEVCIGDGRRNSPARRSSRSPRPRVTCFRVGCGWASREFPALLVSHHRPGFYMRVITEGHITGRRSDRQDPDRAGSAVGGGHRRAAVPARPGHRQAARAALRIGALSPVRQGSFRATCSPPRPRNRGLPGPLSQTLRVSSHLVVEDAAVCSVYLAAGDGTALSRPRRPGST